MILDSTMKQYFYHSLFYLSKISMEGYEVKKNFFTDFNIKLERVKIKQSYFHLRYEIDILKLFLY